MKSKEQEGNGKMKNLLIYARKSEGEIIQTARLKLLGTGRYAFETSLFCGPYELNMNMPLFNTRQQAIKWINSQDKWENISCF